MASENKPHKELIDQLLAQKKAHAKKLSPSILFEKIKKGDKGGLAEAITLVESQRSSDIEKAQELIKLALPLSGKSIRIGITGVPGAGKSTFIESFGLHLLQLGKKVAVLAIDPSSEKSGGAILGDKTRMNELSQDKNAFIRPSANSGSLGGVARKTRESILLCEAAGFDVILIETVGVGQSEIAVHSMTDFFLLLMLAGAGDELQGIKRGIMEMADSILITKADGKNVKMANLARAEYKSALHLFPPNENNWIPRVETVSAYENRGIDKAWDIIDEYVRLVQSNGWLAKKRQSQQLFWMNETLKDQLLLDFKQTPGMAELKAQLKTALISEEITSFQAAEALLNYYRKTK